MMTPAEHYRRADELAAALEEADQKTSDRLQGVEAARYNRSQDVTLALAQVHAVLATVPYDPWEWGKR